MTKPKLCREIQNNDLEIKNYSGTVQEFFEETSPIIGQIIHNFCFLDGELNAIVCELINEREEDLGTIVLHSLVFGRKTDLFYRLVRYQEINHNIQIPVFSSVVSDLRKCDCLINAMVHAEWTKMVEKDYKEYEVVEMKYVKDGAELVYIQFLPASLNEIEEFIYKTKTKLEKFIRQRRERMV
jgi:hypothetical protein